ncbi:hypothetical protein RF679_15635 [Undibacterium cyanobacteriorum]|uniref:DUF2442 domain-containing protein n=1 Tax=Undibacterium cyanobacteriorum TaxID=3073561 RepID=A0ABY9RIF2_9BURK|nr:hypothetical protein [Undibacterium sp. 20NA77.5]WMW80065.1 hypothetical protein RF679_15635 [Undibacterium sp. 20NA77.5]
MKPDVALHYEVHTGRELEMMLRGDKPFAHFYDQHPEEPCEEVIPEQAFAPYVDAGTFEKFEYVELLRKPPRAQYSHVKGIRHVFYACIGEAWRFDAYVRMQLELAPNGWSIALECMQGRLLGYEDWQTDLHLERWRKHDNADRFPWLFVPEESDDHN